MCLPSAALRLQPSVDEQGCGRPHRSAAARFEKRRRVVHDVRPVCAFLSDRLLVCASAEADRRFSMRAAACAAVDEPFRERCRRESAGCGLQWGDGVKIVLFSDKSCQGIADSETYFYNDVSNIRYSGTMKRYFSLLVPQQSRTRGRATRLRSRCVFRLLPAYAGRRTGHRRLRRADQHADRP